ncbi:hypothetical protein N4P33_08965 [Streptomyces sp. 15-116A]|uniref:hypothetical protein n=1 Tax=Streptomyces sp. 15-116A TaxID=2259035 RepID=UPI0021B3F39A|nr:hypothetical protein [Streptomyces sp. 15-116A]MCT7352305.1 hypothetical protein [Streptomyces sp. 15-116A]
MIQMTEEIRRGRRARLLSDEPGLTVRPAGSVFAFYGVCTAVPLAVAVFCFVVRPDDLLVVGVLAALAAAVASAPLVVRLIDLQRARSTVRRVHRAADFGPAESTHAVAFGFHAGGETEVSRWDAAPAREGVLVIREGCLQLRSADGASLELPLDDVLGAVLATAPRTASVDLYTRDGHALELRTSRLRLRAVAAALSGAGVRLVQEQSAQS